MIVQAAAPTGNWRVVRPVWGPAQPIIKPDSRLALLRQRLRAIPPWERAAQPTATPGQPAPPPGSFVSEEERSKFSAEQLEFLERKRRAAAGLGPVMPVGCQCVACSGEGLVACPQCGGSGVNATDKAAELFNSEQGVVKQNNGLEDVQWFFRQDLPCWLCRGKQTIACPDCGGSGMKGLSGYVAD
ncbi:hypothetical protein ABPG77_004021 [Micractinium sp. CCAP 211/92]